MLASMVGRIRADTRLQDDCTRPPAVEPRQRVHLPRLAL